MVAVNKYALTVEEIQKMDRHQVCFLYTYIHIYTYTHIHIYIYTYIHIYIYTYMHFSFWCLLFVCFFFGACFLCFSACALACLQNSEMYSLLCRCMVHVLRADFWEFVAVAHAVACLLCGADDWKCWNAQGEGRGEGGEGCLGSGFWDQLKGQREGNWGRGERGEVERGGGEGREGMGGEGVNMKETERERACEREGLRCARRLRQRVHAVCVLWRKEEEEEEEDLLTVHNEWLKTRNE